LCADCSTLGVPPLQLKNVILTNVLRQFLNFYKTIKDYPARFEGYLDIINLITISEDKGKGDLALRFSREMAARSAPKKARDWANGVINRMESVGRPIKLRFIAVDGRAVDLAEMRGKVVLIDFGATWCPPCVAALPKVKAAFDRYHRPLTGRPLCEASG
jgi:hypothetical protein